MHAFYVDPIYVNQMKHRIQTMQVISDNRFYLNSILVVIILDSHHLSNHSDNSEW